MAAETFGAAAAIEAYKDVKSLVFSLDQARDYEKNIDEYYKTLKQEAENLYARRMDVLSKINRDKGKQATKECQLWIDSVNRIEYEVLTLESKYDEEKKHPRGVSRIWKRAELSKSIVEKYGEVHICWTKGSNFAVDVVVDRAPEVVVKIKAPKIDDKPSIYGVIEEMLEFLRDDDVERIGIWGMVGVGKTSIMKNLNNNEHVAKMFDIVIFVTLMEGENEEKSRPAQVILESAKQKLQLDIAQRLKLNLEGITDTNTIASRISEELKGKRYLLLLDNIWSWFDLDDIGICDNEECSKVVLASRHRDFCLDMGASDIIEVKPLTDSDARKLFREKFGRDMTTDFDKVAQLIIRECGNLPLLIDRTARILRKKYNIHLWWAGLRSLQKFSNAKFEAMDEVLSFCCKVLEDEVKKACFLYGALHPVGREIHINYLLECWRAEGFIYDVGEFTAHAIGLDILGDLINVSLLEIGVKMRHVRMSRVLWNLALKILSDTENSKYLVKACEGLREVPHKTEWEQAKWISLMDNKLYALPENPNCNNLSTLLLQRNHDLTDIPTLFFGSMQSLQVLDLHRTNISKLPPSLSSLTSLKALYLNSCNQLMEFPSKIDALEHLEVLDIRGTRIDSLPIQIGRLQKLRCLRLSLSNNGDGSSSKERICQKVISKLSLLEELVIDVHPENKWWIEVVQAIAEEVATLTKLNSLSFCFPEIQSLSIFIMKSSTWKSPCFTFQISIGHCHSSSYDILEYSEHEICRHLKYANGEGIHGTMKEILAETNTLELIGYKGSLRLSDLGIESVNKLRRCVIEGCKEVETIVDGNGMMKGMLECLQKMYISDAPKLESIWEGPVPDGSLNQLNTLVISKCSKLKKIFSRGMIPQLFKLQHLQVEECPEIEEIIIESENNGSEPGALPSLTTLILHDLPNLKSIWAENSMKCPSLKCCKITMCPPSLSYPF